MNTSMKLKRYMVHPGYVRSLRDGDVHYVGFSQLVGLYRVEPSECVDASRPQNQRGFNEEEFIHLYPRLDGDYSLPKS